MNFSPGLENTIQTIWLTRADLRDHSAGDRELFECWLILNGRREYRALEGRAVAGLNILLQPSPKALREVTPYLTKFQECIWRLRPDLQQAFSLDTVEGQKGFIWWYFIYGIVENDLTDLVTASQMDFLNAADPEVLQDAELPVTRLMTELRRRIAELQSSFPVTTVAGRAGLVDWFLQHGEAATRYGVLFERLKAQLVGKPTVYAAQTRAPRHLSHASGVNLIGFARGEFGIGEDVRMAARALEAVGIPFGIYNVQAGPGVSQNDSSAASKITDTLAYQVNIFCMTGMDTATLAAKDGPDLFEGRHNIGYWPWELAEWPEQWRHAYELVDELWASTRHTYGAYAGSCPKPVRHMPMAVTVDSTGGLGRSDFGLPTDHFLFLFSFDVLSSVSRKNPSGCVRAFRKAFPLGTEPVGLVVKVMRGTADNPHWLALLVEADRDRRITIIDGVLERGHVLDLCRACDSFVSLHRAEGYGRGIAEAMLLEKPVIVTGYSGNLDFTTPASAALVDHRLRPLEPGDYPFADGLHWAEPDLDHAAWWMRRLAEDQLLRRQIAATGRLLAEASCAPSVVGANYRRVLASAVPGWSMDTPQVRR